MKLVGALVFLVACSSSSTTTGGSFVSDAGPLEQEPVHHAPTGVSDAPTLSDYQSDAQDTVPAGNTPIPTGVVCTPSSATATDIAYSCIVYVSKTQTAKATGGWSCTAENIQLTGGDPVTTITLMATNPPPTGADFGFFVSKASFPTLGTLQLNADCSAGGVIVNRLYSLSGPSS